MCRPEKGLWSVANALGVEMHIVAGSVGCFVAMSAMYDGQALG